jgi:DNA-binding transcriptional LysR family regulator
MNINYEYYRIFYYVAKYCSFTKAANVLGSNQPNVTRTMNRLENELNCKLFVRSNRGVALTPEGERLFAHVEIALEHIQAGEGELTDSASLQYGSVFLGASETALNLFLLEKLRQFHERFPAIRLHITNHSTPQALSALKNGTVDCAVVTTPASVEKPFQKTVLTPFQEILVGGTSFRELTARKHHLKDLEAFPLIMLGQGTVTWDFYTQLFLAHGLAMEPDTEVATADQILPLVKYDLGLGFLPEAIAQDAIARGEVFPIPLYEEIPQRNVILVQDGHRPLSIAAREFIKMLKQ